MLLISMSCLFAYCFLSLQLRSQSAFLDDDIGQQSQSQDAEPSPPKTPSYTNLFDCSQDVPLGGSAHSMRQHLGGGDEGQAEGVIPPRALYGNKSSPGIARRLPPQGKSTDQRAPMATGEDISPTTPTTGTVFKPPVGHPPSSRPQFGSRPSPGIARRLPPQGNNNDPRIAVPKAEDYSKMYKPPGSTSGTSGVRSAVGGNVKDKSMSLASDAKYPTTQALITDTLGPSPPRIVPGSLGGMGDGNRKVPHSVVSSQGMRTSPAGQSATYDLNSRNIPRKHYNGDKAKDSVSPVDNIRDPVPVSSASNGLSPTYNKVGTAPAAQGYYKKDITSQTQGRDGVAPIFRDAERSNAASSLPRHAGSNRPVAGSGTIASKSASISSYKQDLPGQPHNRDGATPGFVNIGMERTTGPLLPASTSTKRNIPTYKTASAKSTAQGLYKRDVQCPTRARGENRDGAGPVAIDIELENVPGVVRRPMSFVRALEMSDQVAIHERQKNQQHQKQSTSPEEDDQQNLYGSSYEISV
ncbi:hypothetical protein LSH36_40g08015 [Paralvinella palmiformis]|uniref:Uncharacterized protein n=1 Tax=Paralvinella palmiformis TaxID=53620 RepID=A0AAD9NDH9_9ANNE|nr:hypothetical protein LSH36_40g08015 [Paralvinella palmiformis]